MSDKRPDLPAPQPREAPSIAVKYVRLPDRNGHRTVRIHICAGDGYVPPHARMEHPGLILRAVAECREVRCDGPHYSVAIGPDSASYQPLPGSDGDDG